MYHTTCFQKYVFIRMDLNSDLFFVETHMYIRTLVGLVDVEFTDIVPVARISVVTTGEKSWQKISESTVASKYK